MEAMILARQETIELSFKLCDQEEISQKRRMRQVEANERLMQGPANFFHAGTALRGWLGTMRDHLMSLVALDATYFSLAGVMLTIG
jgi:hypothetical protein